MASYQNFNFSFVRGDTVTIEIEVFDENNQPYVLTNHTIYFTMKKFATDTSSLLTKTYNNFNDNKITITLTANETKNLPAGLKEAVYDVRLKTPDNEVVTILMGKIQIIEPITVL